MLLSGKKQKKCGINDSMLCKDNYNKLRIYGDNNKHNEIKRSYKHENSEINKELPDKKLEMPEKLLKDKEDKLQEHYELNKEQKERKKSNILYLFIISIIYTFL